MSQKKCFRDFAKEELPLEGDKIKIEQVLDRELLVTGYRIRKSRYPKSSNHCLTLQVEIDGKKHVLFTGSTVLLDQIEKYGTEIPFHATIVKIDRFFTFS